MSFELIRVRPAWSAPFSRQAIQALPSLGSLEDLTPEWAWGGSAGRGVKVAIVDSGIDASHPAVGGRVAGYVAIVEGAEELTYDLAPHVDTYGHGTACAGIIRSIAPECELYSIQVLGPDLKGRAAHFAAGLRWAVENGMQVCNLSLGTTMPEYYGVFHELADLAYFQNLALVTAANNRPRPSYPSIYASVISVAACDGQDPYRWYYNPRPPVEFGAPGIDVSVPWLDGTWKTTTGNSYAAPHMSGLVAKILGKHPGLTVFQIKTILRALAANVCRDSGSAPSTSEGTTEAPGEDGPPTVADSR